nr:MAG TPA: hypothetical protein [Caudoviricetes sp.]
MSKLASSEGAFYYVQNMKTEKALENTHIWR